MFMGADISIGLSLGVVFFDELAAWYDGSIESLAARYARAGLKFLKAEVAGRFAAVGVRMDLTGE